MKYLFLFLFFLSASASLNAQVIPVFSGKKVAKTAPSIPKTIPEKKKVALIKTDVKKDQRVVKNVEATQNVKPEIKEELVAFTPAANLRKDMTAAQIIVNIEMVRVDGGPFEMGKSFDSNARPPHTVILKDFSIGKYEVTQREWMAVMGWDVSGNKNCDYCPMENVTFLQVMEFIQKLNLLTGLTYRLPTEAEWEFAARGGSKSKHRKYAGSGYLERVGWSEENSGGKTHEVGQKQPNELGLHDMSGNVWEKCSDWNGDLDNQTETNPKGAEYGTHRVVRGGSYLSPAYRHQVTYFTSQMPDDRSSAEGFRLAIGN